MAIPGAEKKVVAGILGILLGWVGAHRFYLGDTKGGLIRLVIGICTLGSVSSIIGIIEGIIYLTKSDEEFVELYINQKKAWF